MNVDPAKERIIKEKTIAALEDMITTISRDDVIVIGAGSAKQTTRAAGKHAPRKTGLNELRVNWYVEGDSELNVIEKQEIEGKIETVISNSG